MDFMKEYEKWLASPALSQEEHAELESIRSDPKEIESRFYGPLEFGTAGLRGTMAVGLHNMNIHVIRWATQGFADVISAEGEEGKRRGVAICMDCRNHSMEFARAAAEVCAANGIHVRIFESLRPTPELSFAVREYHCQAGINVTASHNPKEYNGYKVYWADGAQLPPHHADAIARKMAELDLFTSIQRLDYDAAVSQGLITLMGAETDEAFLSRVMGQVNDRAAVGRVADDFKIVYTPFHGTGYKLIPEALKRLGMKHVICVPQQMVIDGNFPTVASPNPENPEGFAIAVQMAKEQNVSFIMGSDPDADRIGIMVRDKVVKMYGREFPCLDGGFAENEPVDVVIRPEDIDIVPVEQGQLVGTVTGVTFKGMQYDIIVDFRGFKWLIQTTDHSPVGARIGVKIDPDGFHIMKKSQYSGMFGDYSSYSEEYDELSDVEALDEEEAQEDREEGYEE